MVGNLYDSVLSIMNQTGYIDRVKERGVKSLLRWSSSELFSFNKEKRNVIYSIIAFSHDDFFRAPHVYLVKEDVCLFLNSNL